MKQGHWYPEQPTRGQGYRCLRLHQSSGQKSRLCARPVDLAVGDDPVDRSRPSDGQNRRTWIHLSGDCRRRPVAVHPAGNHCKVQQNSFDPETTSNSVSATCCMEHVPCLLGIRCVDAADRNNLLNVWVSFRLLPVIYSI